MADVRLDPIPTAADADDDQRSYAVIVDGLYAGRVESQPNARFWAAYRPNGGLISNQFTSRRDAVDALTPATPSRAVGDEANGHDGRRPHTALYVTDAELAMLQRLAASLGYYTQRGPHAKARGSVTALAAALARAAEDDGQLTLASLRVLFGRTKYRA
jgi:hypothetical protein